MKKLTKKSFDSVRSWIYRNARQIELSIWQYEFENGKKEEILSALSLFQNSDGGFGNALEPDSWNPNSSPYTTLWAIDILKNIDFSDINHQIMQGIFMFLESGVHSNENGWFFNIPSNDNYPHAPWWKYNPEENEYEHIGVSAGIICFLLKYANKETKLYERAISIANTLICKLKEASNYGDMGVDGYYTLLGTINKLGLTEKFDINFLTERTKELVYNAIERDVSKWAYYGNRPSSFITSTNSLFYEDNKDILELELDYIIETKPENGVWGITWSWFDNNEKYPKEFAISENWWKADCAISKLKLLRNFNRIEK